MIWRGLALDLEWGQVATETQDTLRIQHADGGIWVIRDIPEHGLRVSYHAPAPDPLLDMPPGGAPAPWLPPSRGGADDAGC
ncbi:MULTISPECIES: hypothetical protein [unclassified Xanthobacter]|uniref:hypothetical protein n=1 Tax=unclassified Xanthobacter TaxID=2623496 RepID=UPI001EE03032|nr:MULTISPECIES: hypothetical protein [unclassified Xanthobacter]